MQITLNQAEIEQAIKNYVNDQVNIREGHDITIDLKAGRGPEGFTATIDIVAPGVTKAAEPTDASKPTPTLKLRTQRAVIDPANIEGQPMPGAPETAQEAAEEAAPETATDAQTESQTAQDDAAAADSGDQEAAPATEGEGKKPQSLFANLGKPRN